MATPANLLTPNPADPSTWTVARSNLTFKNQDNKIVTDQLNLRIDFDTGAIKHNLSTGIEYADEKLDARGIAVVTGHALARRQPVRPELGCHRPAVDLQRRGSSRQDEDRPPATRSTR